MVRGLYTSAVGMMTQMQKMDVVSNNIANSDTVGFKKDTVVVRSFSEELSKRLDDPKYRLIKFNQGIGNMSLGVFVDEVYTDFSTGSFEETNGSLDCAISGEGFFAINVTNRNGDTVERYTRDGSFTLDSENNLRTSDGNYVVGEGGNINIPNGVISIDAKGNIFSNNEFVDRIKIVDFSNKESLRKVGDNLYETIDESQEQDFTGSVIQNRLEGSNVNSVQEMVKMISLARNYEANQKMIQTHDSTLNRAVNDIGRKQ
ncbi:MAG: flagellar basal-body rod protein FlgF [Clostridiales bacterium]|nr:flagellar basal-body rod protein FlgF [Clostridiales bacterium]